MTGRERRTIELPRASGESQNAEIVLDDLPEGPYLLHLDVGADRATQSVVIAP
jgi:hypothetical protein